MKKVKVLHFTIANKGGGITKYALRIWEYIDKEKFQCDFATMSKKLDFAHELEEQGCKIHYISTYSEVDRLKFEEEINKILDEDYDVLHLHTGWWRGFDIEKIAKKRKVPKVIVHAHNTGVSDVHLTVGMTREEAENLHYHWRQKVAMDIATDFWACSERAAKWLYGDNIPEEVVRIMPNAIELDKFYYDEMTRTNYREEMGLTDKFVIGMIARFQYQKNHEFAIRFFEKLTYCVDDVVLLLIGIGDLEKDIRELVKEKGLEKKVYFLGARKDVPELLQAMDLLILPSRFEGLPFVAIEAQATGLKCIVSDGISEEVKLTDNIQMLSLDEDLWVKEAVKWLAGYERFDTSQQLAAKGYRINDQIKKIEALYSDFKRNLDLE